MKPTKEMLAAINALALEGSFSDEDLEVFQFLAADGQLTAHHTKFDVRTLRKFQRDMQHGDVALLVNHNQRGMLPLGRSFSSVLADSGDVRGQFFIPLKDAYGREREQAMEVASGIKQGTNYDVSVGIHATFYQCNLCGHDVRTWECKHWPGMEFEVKVDEHTVKKEMCFATVLGKKVATDENGMEYFADVGCSELSCVVDGAVERARAERVSFSKDKDGKITAMKVGADEFTKVDEHAEVPELELHVRGKFEKIAPPAGADAGKAVEEEAAADEQELSAAGAEGTAAEGEGEGALEAPAELVAMSKALAKATAQIEKFEAKITELSATVKTAEDALAKLSAYVRKCTHENSIRVLGNQYDQEASEALLAKVDVDGLIAAHGKAVEALSQLATGRQSPAGALAVSQRHQVLSDSAFKAR